MDSFKNFADKTKATIASKTKKSVPAEEESQNSLDYDEENPFEEEEPIVAPKPKKQPAYDNNNVAAAAVPKKAKAKTPSSASGTPQIASNDGTGLTAAQLSSREKEIKAREDKLLAMERQLDKRSAEVEKLAGKMKNWPFKFYPILYHSIDDEIPQPMQKIVRRFYRFWQFMALTLIVNWVAILIITFQAGSTGIIDVLLASFYIVTGIPGSWLIWYRPFYKTMKAKSSVSWSFFIAGFTIHWLYVICMGISVPWFAGAGIVVFIKVVTTGYSLSIIFNLVAMGLWFFAWLATTYLTKKARDEYKAAGQNLASMKSGFVGEAIKLQIKG
jgi:hypothetical protein